MGGNAQTKAMKKVAGKLRLDLSQYRDLEAFAQFGSELDPETQKTLNRGERLVEMLKQKEREPLEVADQVAAIYSGTGGYLDRVKTERVGEFLRDLRIRLRSEKADLLGRISETGKLEEADEEALGKAIAEFVDDFGADFDEHGDPVEAGESDRIKSEEERAKPSRVEEAESRRGGEGGRPRLIGDGSLLAHGLPEGRQESHLVDQEHQQDHEGDGDGGGGAAAPRRAADRRPAPLRGGDAQADPPRRRAGGRHAARAGAWSSARSEKRVGVVLITGDRGLAGAFNTNIIRDGMRLGKELRGQRHRAGLLRRRPQGRRRPHLPQAGGEQLLHRLHRPPRLRQRARDRRGADRRATSTARSTGSSWSTTATSRR